MSIELENGLGNSGGSGGGGSSIPSQEGQEGKVLSTNGEELEWVEQQKPTLFDIKTNSEPTAQKGWSCISYPTQNKLNKDNVPTAYNELNLILENADGVLDSLATIVSSDDNQNYQAIEVGDYYVISNIDGKLYKVLKDDIADTSAWEEILNTNINYNAKTFVGNNCFVFFGNDGNTYVMSTTDFSVIKTFNYNIYTDYIYGFNEYIYVVNNSGTCRFKDSNNANEIELELVIGLFELFGMNCYISKIFYYDENTGYYYFNRISGDNGTETACRALNLSDITTYEAIGYNTYKFMDYNYGNDRFILWNNWDKFYETDIETSPNGEYSNVPLFQFDNMIEFDNLNNLDLSQYTSLTIDKSKTKIEHYGYRGTIIHYTTTSFGGDLLLATEDYETFTEIFDQTYDNDGGLINYCYDGQKLVISDRFIGSVLSQIRSADKVKTVYTDTINGIDIKYYKNGDWKICTPDIAVGNDDNLQSVYEFLGYLNYWWIDTTNEQISLQRNSNLWTMMYVGDDYEDDELPSGNATRLLPQSELIEIDTASITLDILKNKVYKFTNTDITDIEFSSYENSDLPTSIKFSTGNSAPTFTDNSGINWVDGTPIFQANKTYQIIIFDNDGYLKEF